MVSGTVPPARPAVPSGWNRAPSLRRAAGESQRGPEWYQLKRAGPASASSSSVRASGNRGAGTEGMTRPPPPRYVLSVGSSHNANG